MKTYTNMTLADAKAAGYTLGELVYTQCYISRRVDVDQQPVMVAGGTRSGQLYVELPNWRSTRFSFRQYLLAPVEG